MFNIKKKKNGISLITLMVTIIVIIILATAIILTFFKNNPLKAAKAAKIGSSVVALQDALDLYKMTAMASTTEIPTLLELSTADKISQLELEDKTGSKNLYNIVIPNNLDVNTDLGKNPKSRTKLKDIFVLDVNDYVIYIDDDGTLWPNKDADIAIDPIGPVYTEDNLPEGFIPIYTIDQFNKISTGETNYEIKNNSGVSKGKFNMTPNSVYVLMNDLDFASVVNQVPIKGFQGTFEGNRYTVKNINMDVTTSITEYTSVINGYEIAPPGGLFDRVTNGNVLNLTIDTMKLTGAGSLGALMGENTSTTVTSCKVLNSTINSTNGSGAGLIGFVNNAPATITKAKVISSTIAGYSSSGGIIATSFGDLTINSSRVENVNVKRAGYVGFTNNNLTLNSCKAVNITSEVGMVNIANGNNVFTNCEVSNLKGKNSGIIYNSNGTFKAINCDVNNSVLDSDGCTAGVIAVSNSTTELDGCDVDKLTINNSDNWNDSSGLVVYSKYDVKITNSSFTNSTIKNGGEVAGLISSALQKSQVENCNVQNVVFDSCGQVGGLISYSWDNANIINSNCENLSMSGGNTGGIICISGKITTVDNCNVKNLKTNNNSNNNGGIVANSLGDCKVTNSSVESLNLIGGYYAGGIIANASKKSEIDNCMVKNTIINLISDDNGSVIGSSLGESKITNTNVENINLTSQDFAGGLIALANNKLQVENCNVSNFSLSSNKCGGISALTNGGLIINNSNVNELKIIGDTYDSGGLVALAIASGGNNNITNCNLQKINIEKCQGNGGGVAGILAGNTTLDNINVTDTNINGIESMGLLLKMSLGTNLSIKNCNVKNSTVTARNVAGIIAFPQNSSSTIIQNCNVESTKVISNSTSGYALAGGLVGQGWNIQILDSNIKNGTVLDQTTTPSHSNIGGIIGLSGGVTIKNNKVEGTIITSVADTAGGVAGRSSNSVIESCNVTGSEISSNGNLVGGITGLINESTLNKSKVLNCSVSNSKVTSNRTSSTAYDIQYSSAGGISGNSGNIAITGCNFTDSTLTTKKIKTGGIAGYGYNIKNCIVSKATLNDSNTETVTIPTSLTESFYINSLGGIVGHGSNYTSSNPIIENCKVLDSTLNGCDAVGGISGAANSNIVSCEVNGTKINGVGKGIGGIQGFGGILNASNEAVKINNCNIKNSQLKGGTNVNYFLGYNSFYPTDTTVLAGSRLTDLITGTIYENITIN